MSNSNNNSVPTSFENVFTKHKKLILFAPVILLVLILGLYFSSPSSTKEPDKKNNSNVDVSIPIGDTTKIISDSKTDVASDYDMMTAENQKKQSELDGVKLPEDIMSKGEDMSYQKPDEEVLKKIDIMMAQVNKKKPKKDNSSNNNGGGGSGYSAQPKVKVIKEEPVAVQETPKPVVTQEPPKPRTLEDIIRAKNQSGKSASSSNNIRVAIHSNQKISSSNTTVKLRLLEPITINGQTIGTDQFIYAKASMGNNAVNLYVENINYNNTIIPVGLWAYDNRTGNKGITVENNDIIASSTQKVAENKSSGVISKYGGEVGGVIKDIFAGRNKQQTIQLVNETYLILMKEK